MSNTVDSCAVTEVSNSSNELDNLISTIVRAMTNEQKKPMPKVPPRMRTQAEVMKHLKENDPDSRLTAHALRALVLSGRIPSVTIGDPNSKRHKRLINIDLLDQYLANIAEEDSQIPTRGYGTIRPIQYA